jgi:serine/threonine-protein kinase
MKAIDRLVLATDLAIAPADSFAPEVRERLGAKDSDRVITRPHSRARSLVVDARAAAFVERFRSPSTVIEAVLLHAAENGDDPAQLLEIAMPLVLRLRQQQLLAVEGDAGGAAIHPTFAPGAHAGGVEVIRCVHLFDDVEVYCARLFTGENVALKILRRAPSVRSQQMVDREAAILEQLAGVGVPALLGKGEMEGRPYLLQSWCDGIDAARAAAICRPFANASFSAEVLALCANIVRAYAELHARGIIHGDVHPGNVRIGKDGTVTILDFGIARSGKETEHLPSAGRGGLHDYLEPEYCAALLLGETPPPATPQSDQYSLGALLYLLLTGSASQEFSFDRDVWLRQVAEGRPLPFAARQRAPWPQMEAVLARALATDPSSRFASTGELLAAFERATAGKRARRWSPPSNAQFLASVLVRVAPEEIPLRDHLIDRLVAPRCSINYGAAGIAWFLYRTAGMRDDPRLLAAADVWCTRARQLADDEAAFASAEIGITREVTGGISPFHSVSGIHLVQAHVSAAMGDTGAVGRAARAFAEACAEPRENPDLTLGWTSVLLGCACLVELLARHDVDCAPVLALGTRLAGCVEGWMAEQRISDACEMRWLGLAHGWAGLLFGLLRWTEASGVAVAPIVRERLHDLARLGIREGNSICWPLRLGNDASDRAPFTGWCHGSAGYLLLWTLAYRVLGRGRFLALARGSARHIAASIGSERIVDSSLCCGSAGQGFALLALHRATGEPESLRLAGELCERAVQYAGRTTRPNSLFKGDVGIALLVQEIAQPLRASMPLVETEGW